MMKTMEFDASAYLDSEEDIINYLNAVVEQNDPKLLQAAIGDIAKARGMSEIARETGLGRESLYKSLSETGNPSFATIQKILITFGVGISLTPLKTV